MSATRSGRRRPFHSLDSVAQPSAALKYITARAASVDKCPRPRASKWGDASRHPGRGIGRALQTVHAPTSGGGQHTAGSWDAVQRLLRPLVVASWPCVVLISSFRVLLRFAPVVAAAPLPCNGRLQLVAQANTTDVF
jgi:hypothetical protein